MKAILTLPHSEAIKGLGVDVVMCPQQCVGQESRASAGEGEGEGGVDEGGYSV